MWVDENQQNGSSSSTSVPQGLEELLVSQLRRPANEKAPDQKSPIVEPENKVEDHKDSDAGPKPETLAENTVNNGSTAGPTGNEPLQGADSLRTNSQSVEMQLEPNDASLRDVEAVSQGSSGSGATLGESLRSLDVEIGSADGHDEGGERQGNDLQATRTRRTNLSFGTSPMGGRDVSLHSVTEVSENPSQESDQSGSAEEQRTDGGDADAGSIDPAFLDALPEELRAEVLSAQQGQAAQPSNTEEQQNNGDIDPEFLAALPPDIRAEVLAQQQAQQRQNQSQELEGQPVEMDTVSIIATFPSDLREEVHWSLFHSVK